MALAQSQAIRFRGTNRRWERAAVVTLSPTIEAEVALIWSVEGERVHVAPVGAPVQVRVTDPAIPAPPTTS
jgi:hypothetical protein